MHMIGLHILFPTNVLACNLSRCGSCFPLLCFASLSFLPSRLVTSESIASQHGAAALYLFCSSRFRDARVALYTVFGFLPQAEQDRYFG
jgi:hypothetical protein